MEKRLDNIADIYSSTITLIKRLTTYNLYDLQSIESNLETFHHKWTSLKVTDEFSIKIDKYSLFIYRQKFYNMKLFFIKI